ncbi:hypothetical protein WA158_008431 [Blastocystis sp. Blastoise]
MILKNNEKLISSDITVLKSKFDSNNNNNCIIKIDSNDNKNVNKQFKYNNNINNKKDNFSDSSDNKNKSNSRDVSPNNKSISHPPMNDLPMKSVFNNNIPPPSNSNTPISIANSTSSPSPFNNKINHVSPSHHMISPPSSPSPPPSIPISSISSSSNNFPSNLHPHSLDNNQIKNFVKSPNNNKVKDNSFDKSIILNDNSQYITSLTNWLGKEKKWKLLFRASEHYYLASQNNHINIYGGYTDQKWDRSNEYEPNSKEFLFTLSNEHNIAPSQYYYTNITKIYGICCYPNYGPTFGAHSYDLVNTNEKSSLFVNTNDANSENEFIVEDYEVWGRA